MSDPHDPEQQPLLASTSDSAGPSTGNEPPASLLARTRTALHNPKRLNGLEKALAALAILLLVLVAVFAGLFAGETVKYKHHRHDGREGGRAPTATVTATATSTVPGPTQTVRPMPGLPGKNGEVCLTGSCVKSAAKVLSSLDTTVDPCEDFYHFANGGWLATHSIPPGQGGFGTFQQVDEANKRIIRSIIDSKPDPSLPEADQRNLKHLRSFWASCTDESSLEKQGQGPLLDVAAEVVKAWRGSSGAEAEEEEEEQFYAVINGMDGPQVRKGRKDGKWDPKTKKERLTDALSFLHSRGIDALFNAYTEGDVGRSPSTNVLWLSQAGLGLPSKDYYSDKDTVKFYEDVAQEVLKEVYGLRKESTVGAELAKEVVELEKKIAKASLDAADLDLPIPTYNRYNSSALQALFPSITFADYFASFTPRPQYPDPVIVTSPEFFGNLSKIVDRTAPDVLEAYFVLQTVLAYGELLGPKQPLAKSVSRFSNHLSGVPAGESRPRPEICLDAALSSLGFLIGRPFVEEAFPGESKEYAEGIIWAIIGAFKERLPGRTWLDEETREKAREKVEAIKVKIGYPTSSPNTSSPESIERYYSLNLPIEKDDFVGNVLRSRVADQRRMWAKVGMERDEGEWDMVPSEVNAYYQPSANEIVFPAGILQTPFFNVDWPEYLNFGAFGGVASHELAHASDQAGRLYDGQGYLRDWWTKEAAKAFEERQQCFREQYRNYTITGPDGKEHPIDSSLTGGEDGADNGGVKLAFTAWKTRLDSDPKGEKYKNYELPGLGEYSREQLFFLAYAQGWARKVTPEEALRRIRTDPHSPTQYRVIGPLSNSEQFAKAWNCPVGSVMNRGEEKRCEIW
ncbi:hypothetical protein JCM10213_005237 [Rhodosporidiobolus nylandii]